MSNALAVYHGRFGRVTLYNLNRAMATHAHREGHLTFHVQGKDAHMMVTDEFCPITPINATVVNSWQPHSFHPGDANEGSLFLVLYINPIWFLESSKMAQGALRFGRTHIDVTHQIQKMVLRISSLLLQDEPADQFDNYIYELTQECFDQSWQMSQGAKPVNDRWSGLRDHRIRNAIRFMKERINDELVLNQIARDSGLSRPHFFKLFREQVGLTPNVYLNTLRMETAIERLTNSMEAITTIGLDLGFASQPSFTRFFTSNVGIPPTNYRHVAHTKQEFGDYSDLMPKDHTVRYV